MTTEERVKQLEDVMVEMLRKQDRTVEELAQLREGQSELNTKLVRIENRVERTDKRVEGLDKRVERVEDKLQDQSRNIMELRRDVEKFQQEATASLNHIIDLIRGSK